MRHLLPAQCQFVVMNLTGRHTAKGQLSHWRQDLMRRGQIAPDMDPCILLEGHVGSHILTTMTSPDSEEEIHPAWREL